MMIIENWEFVLFYNKSVEKSSFSQLYLRQRQFFSIFFQIVFDNGTHWEFFTTQTRKN